MNPYPLTPKPCPNLCMKKLAYVLLLALTGFRAAALELPSTFGSGMVLQRDMPVKIWGTATPGERVEATFAGESQSAIAGSDGTWTLHLGPLQASFEARSLVVSTAGDRKQFENVLVGEVWVASGQSNMGWQLNQSADADLLKLGARDEFLRLYIVSFQPSDEPKFTGSNRWEMDSPQNAGRFSSVAYQFARELRQTLNVPVGILSSAVGGTPAIAWTRPEKIRQVEHLVDMVNAWKAKMDEYPQRLAAWEKEYAVWREKKGLKAPDYEVHRRQGAPQKPDGPDSPRRPSCLANGMITPIAGYSARGFIWYQGEQDANGEAMPELYSLRLTAMIEDWREWWGRPDMFFGIVQLPNYMKAATNPTGSYWAKLRESQRQVALNTPNVGLAVTIDLGEENDIHPPQKSAVARRLARWALADVYGLLDLRGGPEIVSARWQGGSVILEFSSTGSGLHVWSAPKLDGFTASDVAGEPDVWWQTNFYSVEAEILSPTKVKLSVPEGRKPTRIRYAWANNPVTASLANRERLPAGPFEVTITE